MSDHRSYCPHEIDGTCNCGAGPLEPPRQEAEHALALQACRYNADVAKQMEARAIQAEAERDRLRAALKLAVEALERICVAVGDHGQYCDSAVIENGTAIHFTRDEEGELEAATDHALAGLSAAKEALGE